MAIREYMNIRSHINILKVLGQHEYLKLHKYFMAIREYTNIRSYVTSGEHGYAKLHKCFMAIRANMNIPSYIKFKWLLENICNLRTLHGYPAIT